MASIHKSFPFPILGNGDDMEGRFNVEFIYRLDPERTLIQARFHLVHPTIQALIDASKAKFLTEVTCSNTFYRQAFETNETSIQEYLAADDLRDRVDVRFYIYSTVDIDDYYPEGLHPDLQGDPILVNQGDVLAYGGSTTFIADKNFDPLRSPATSLIALKEKRETDGPISISYADKILIELPKNDYALYQNSKTAPALLHCSLVLPALIDALHTMNSKEGDNYKDLPWYVRIVQICREREYDLQKPVETAQLMLAHPINRGMHQLSNMLDADDIEGVV